MNEMCCKTMKSRFSLVPREAAGFSVRDASTSHHAILYICSAKKYFIETYIRFI